MAASAEAEGELFAEGRVSAGVTSYTDDTTEDGALENAHAFTTLMPSAIYRRLGGRTHHAARYTLSTRMNMLQAGSSTISNRLDWRSHIDASPSSELSLGASVHQGHTSAYDLVLPQIIEPFPAAGIHFVRSDVEQSFGHQLSRAWRIGQRARAGVYYPISGDLQVDHSYEAGGELDLERQFRYEAVTGGLYGRYVSIARPEVDGAELPVRDRHVVGGLRISGSHALSERWTAELGGGVAGVADVESPSDPLVRPTARAALSYGLAGGSAGLSYSYDIDTRLMSAETSATHLAQLAGGVPVTTMDGVWVAGAIGYRSGRIIDSREGDSLGTNNVLLVDGQIAWEFRRGLAASAQVQTHQQTRTDIPTMPRQRSNRSQFMLSLAARFPPEGGDAPPPGVRAAPAGDGAGEGAPPRGEGD